MLVVSCDTSPDGLAHSHAVMACNTTGPQRHRGGCVHGDRTFCPPLWELLVPPLSRNMLLTAYYYMFNIPDRQTTVFER